MISRKLISACCAIILITALVSFMSGCGGGGSTATSIGETGVAATGSLLATRSRGAGGAGYDQLNPNFKDAYLIPSAISVAVAKFELLKGEDDASPYVVFDKGTDLSQAAVIDLLNDGATAQFGANTEYPEPGTYTHVRMTMVYIDQTLPMDIGDGLGTIDHHCRVYGSTVGAIEDGDVTMDINGEFCWIQGDGFFPVTGTRPPPFNDWGSEIVQFAPWAADDEESPDPLVMVLALPTGEEVVVPANPTGRWVVNVAFDITRSPLVVGSEGILMYDDVDEDGQWEPAVNDEDGGDSTQGDEAGDAGWQPLPPTMSVTFRKA